MIEADKVTKNRRFTDLVELEFSRWKRLGRSEDMREIAYRILTALAQTNGYTTTTISDVKPTRRPFGVLFTEGRKRWQLQLNSHKIKLCVLI